VPSSKHYKKYVNPGNIPDGHCASCAFNTYLLLIKRINPEDAEAFAPGSEEFKSFGDWFYEKFVTDIDNNVDLVVSIGSGNGTIEKFEKLVKDAILEKTTPNTAVIICVDYGTHWYNAYRTENDVIFIDSQNGKQFNAYSTTLPKDTNIDIIIPKKKVIDKYFGSVLPKIQKKKEGGKIMRKKKRKTNKKKKSNKKTRRLPALSAGNPGKL
jgi:hypothetical protein